MGARTRYEANVCVLLRRDGRWLLTVRGPHVAYAPGTIGMVGGHVEPVAGSGVLEATARREVLEETGLALPDVPLHYLASALYLGDDDQPVLTITYAGELPPGPEPQLTAPEELAAVGWWTPEALAAADDCPPWLLPLVTSAGELLDRLDRT